MEQTTARSGIRLAELLASLSLGTDLGLGQPMEHILRTCRVSLGLAERLELSEEERAQLYWVALLAWVGCHVDAYEQAWWFGDDIELRAGTYEVDMKGLDAATYALRRVGSGQAPLKRLRRIGSFIAGAGAAMEVMEFTHCRIAAQLALDLDLGTEVASALKQVFARWDGKGLPSGLAGERIDLTARIVPLADVAAAHWTVGGTAAALEVASSRSGTQFDPALVDLLRAERATVLDQLAETGSWEHVLSLSPGTERVLAGDSVDIALESIADFTNLKSPWFGGHSRAVAALASGAARASGLGEDDVTALRRAALVHDLGRLGISNAIWDKPGPLSHAERERVRLYPYFTQRTLADAAPLARIGTLAARHSERLDGSGYPAGLTGEALGTRARILAAADVYRAMLEPRPYRPAKPAEIAAAELREEVRAGRLDGDAVEAVLGASGHRARRRRQGPAGLTPREIEVLRLLARGCANKAIAAELVISPKTARNHVEHIYAKIGCSTRAEASLFAMRQGLLD